MPKALEKPFKPFGEIRHRRQRAFLIAYSECGMVKVAAEAAQVDRSMHYHWMKQPRYAKAFAEAKILVCELIDSEIIRRAVHGTIKKKFHLGEPIYDPDTKDPVTGEMKQYIEREWDTQLLILAAKANMPQKYGSPFVGTNSDMLPGTGPVIQIVLNRIDPASFVPSKVIEQQPEPPSNGENGHTKTLDIDLPEAPPDQS